MYFFDTYAFFEILCGNPNYGKFVQEKAITTIFNIAELNFALKREEKSFADKFSKDHEALVVEVSVDDAIKAMDLRIKNRKLSVPDAIGYTVAQRYNAKFLTGGKEFAKMPNVEFVK